MRRGRRSEGERYDEPSEDRSASDSLPVVTRGGMVGAWWVKLQCPMWAAAVVVSGVPGQDDP
jgi:hypothetical protein